MSAMITPIKQHIERAALIGWRPRRRIGIYIEGGMSWVHIQYRSNVGMWPVRAGDPEDGHGIDMTDMPRGVSVLAWEAPPDDRIALAEIPSRRDIDAIASMTGHQRITCQRGGGKTIYWLDKE